MPGCQQQLLRAARAVRIFHVAALRNSEISFVSFSIGVVRTMRFLARRFYMVCAEIDLGVMQSIMPDLVQCDARKDHALCGASGAIWSAQNFPKVWL